MFNLVVLDDERGIAGDIHKNVNDWGFVEPFVALYKAQTISECLEIPRGRNWVGDWMFLLDCNLSDGFEGTYGGFEAWSLLVAEEPPSRPSYMAVYSQSITDLIESANKGGKRAARALRPRLFKRAVDEKDDIEPWWKSALAWLCDRQAEIVKNASTIKRTEICRELRSSLRYDSPETARKLFSELTLDVRFSGMEQEVWTIAQLFPLQAHNLAQESSANDLGWQNSVVEVCYSLLPQFPKVLNEIGRLIFCDLLNGSSHEEREIGRRLKDTIFHAAMNYEENHSYIEFYERGIRQWFQAALMILKEHRLKTAYHLLPPSLHEVLVADELNTLLEELCAVSEAEQLSEKFGLLSSYCSKTTAAHPWRKHGPDPRKDCTSLPITGAVAETIESVINAQAVRYGHLPQAIQLPTLVEGDDRRYCIFKTQEYGEGDHLNPHLMVERCKAERNNPQKNQLAGLVELVCGQYGGQVYVIQEIREDRPYPRPRRVAVFHASGGRLRSDAVATLPDGLPGELLEGGRIESYLDAEDGKTMRPKGTYYVLVFPHWN